MEIRKLICKIFNHEWGVTDIEPITLEDKTVLYKIKLECIRCLQKAEIILPKQGLKNYIKLDNENYKIWRRE